MNAGVSLIAAAMSLYPPRTRRNNRTEAPGPGCAGSRGVIATWLHIPCSMFELCISALPGPHSDLECVLTAIPLMVGGRGPRTPAVGSLFASCRPASSFLVTTPFLFVSCRATDTHAHRGACSAFWLGRQRRLSRRQRGCCPRRRPDRTSTEAGCFGSSPHQPGALTYRPRTVTSLLYCDQSKLA